MNDIYINVGVYTAIEIDLREFDFTGIARVVMTFKNLFSDDPLFTHEFTAAELREIDVTPEQSALFRSDAMYDFLIITTDGRCYKNGCNGKIHLRRGCGECDSE